MKKLLAVLLCLGIYTGTAGANQIENFELQKQCSKMADEYVKKGSQEGQTTTSQSHYNFQLNKCFVEVSDLSTPKGFIMNSYVVADAISGTEYAGIMFMKSLENNRWSKVEVDNCFINKNVPCTDENQFNSYVKNLMEEDTKEATLL